MNGRITAGDIDRDLGIDTDAGRASKGLPTQADIEMKCGKIPTVPAKAIGGPTDMTTIPSNGKQGTAQFRPRKCRHTSGDRTRKRMVESRRRARRKMQQASRRANR